MRWSAAEIGRLLAVDVDDQLGLAGHATIFDVGGAVDLFDDVGDLRRQASQDLRVLTLDTHLDTAAAPAPDATCRRGRHFGTRDVDAK